MDVTQAIRTRRSIGKVKMDDIPKETIERILEAGTWAPNHRHTEPWKFFVLRGEGRGKLGSALADIAREAAAKAAAGAEEAEMKAEKARSKAFRAPVIIAVAVTPSAKEGVLEIEEYGAVSAAIQNMLLEIHALGLGAVWRTGDPAYHPLMNEHFGLGQRDKMLGFIYLGVPEAPALEGRRQHYSVKTEWIDQA
ncbi:nitroreductase [Paenibacillus sp. CAA11]|uniref:nitroreductase family protein n=1 Tax=Paenibacillus sp. CAA11 TaxID=1532905 RepID=UPI000D3CC497|nr:nitroreductase [Paenibacillus sp. CAA11]AWB43109.1 nitroreductase [Paenibacillus sp. CAA11]